MVCPKAASVNMTNIISGLCRPFHRKLSRIPFLICDDSDDELWILTAFEDFDETQMEEAEAV